MHNSRHEAEVEIRATPEQVWTKWRQPLAKHSVLLGFVVAVL